MNTYKYPIKTESILPLITLVIILYGALLLMNIFMDNPISKMKAQRETIQYYENAYKEKFTVYNSEYNLLIPAYIFELGPVSNKNVKFSTGLFCQGISDEYGGILASLKISEDIGSILQKEYGYLNYEISAVFDVIYYEIFPFCTSKRKPLRNLFCFYFFKFRGRGRYFK